jgi:hypothetical protein
MFNLFNKKKGHSTKWEIELISKIFNSIGDDFTYIKNQLNDGLIKSVKKVNTPVPNYYKFLFDVNILNKYENKKGRYFCIHGVTVFDNQLNRNVEIQINVSFGIVLGFFVLGAKEIVPNLDRIDINNYRIKYFDEQGIDILTKLLNKEEIKFINPSDVYEIILNGKKYYHLKDMEDGDFIGIDIEKNAYKIIHDPFEITILEKKLIDVLTTL